jgi:hypothetical protein
MSVNALPTAPISLSDLQAEFDEDGFDSTPNSLSYYYRLTLSIPGQGDLVVPPYANITGTYGTIPTSGEISLGQFRGASQGIALQTAFRMYPQGSDPYYLGEAYTGGGGFYTAPGVYIGAGIYVLYVVSALDEASGGVTTSFYFNGDVSSSSATIANHLNGRTRSLGSVSKTYVSGANFTVAQFSEGYSGPGGAYGGGGWPDDGITTNGFLGAPTTWNQSGQVPNVPGASFTYYNSYLRAF